MRRSEHNRIVENLNKEHQFIIGAQQKVIKSHYEKITEQKQYISKLEDILCEGFRKQQELLNQLFEMQLKAEELKIGFSIKGCTNANR